MRALAIGVLAVSQAACQVYDLEKVRPVTFVQTTPVRKQKPTPNVMLLIDRSGSMGFTIPGRATTRMDELKSSMRDFLSLSGGVARMGLAVFPGDGAGQSCQPTNRIMVPLPPAATTDDADAYVQHALSINAQVQSLSADGGTPTGHSLAFVGALPALREVDDREDLVLLLTDGLPNCNGQNVNSACGGGGAACRCTLADCSANIPGAAVNPCSHGCLDGDGVVGEIDKLRAVQIRTIVVGFGADTATGDGPEVLNAMARAGGFARRCMVDADCGAADACSGANVAGNQYGRCGRAYYQAANGAELIGALAEIKDIIGDRCRYSLGQLLPGRQARVLVEIDGMLLTGDTSGIYTLVGDDLQFVGAQCEALKRATPVNPIDVRIRVLQEP